MSNTLNDITHITASKRLLYKAINIFGKDLVLGAYVTTYHSDGSNIVASIRDRLLTELSNIEDYKKEDIDIGAKSILITFCNGKTVEFSSNELGNIKSFGMSGAVLHEII